MRKSILISLLFCISLFAEETSPKWQDKMKQLADVMGELLPELASANSDPKVLEKNAKRLSELAHGIEMGRKSGKLLPPSDLDPSVTILAEKFSDTAKNAYLAIHEERIEYGKGLLQSLTTYCIGCHTRHENGPEFPTFPLNAKTEKLNPAEKAALYISTRQFDKGLSEFEKLIGDEKVAQQQPFAWGRYVRQSLAVSVRVKKDPVLTEKIIQQALKVGTVPEFEKESLMKWKLAVEEWKKEPAIKQENEVALVKEMTRLIQEAKSAHSFPLDHGGEIQYLRASAAAHDVLRVAKNPEVKAEALYIAGTSYDALATPGFWPLHELWYEACIRQLSHSRLAMHCYNRLEESVYFGYTGSAGTNLPGDVRKFLDKMKLLAATLPKSKK